MLKKLKSLHNTTLLDREMDTACASRKRPPVAKLISFKSTHADQGFGC